MATFFISDLHLDAQHPEISQQFLAFLSGPAAQADALYILGDLFEVWIGDDDPEPEKRRIIAGLRALTAEFRDLGGDALEVVSPSHTAAEYASLASIARSCGLGASCGSDFHGPGESRFDFGELPPLPVGIDPVWSRW